MRRRSRLSSWTLIAALAAAAAGAQVSPGNGGEAVAGRAGETSSGASAGAPTFAEALSSRRNELCGLLTGLDARRAELALDLAQAAGTGRQATCLEDRTPVSAEYGDKVDVVVPGLPSCYALARAQAELSALGNRIVRRRAEVLKEARDPEQQLTPARKQEVECLEDLLAKVEGHVEIPDSGHLFQGFDDYSDHFYGFHLGYEYATLSDVLGSSGFPRTGFLVTTRFRGGAPQERTGVDHRYGSQLLLSAQLTSSAEEKIVLGAPGEGEDPPSDASDADKAEPTQSLEFELAWFKPFYSNWATTTEGRRLRHMTGLLLAVGGRKSDQESEADRRLYGGIRLALNPELYGDILYGDTASLRSRRIELRGQLPILHLSGGSRLFLGAIGNFGIDGERKAKLAADGSQARAAEPDSVRIYLSFETDIETLFGL